MTAHAPYPSIEQFRNVVKVVRDRADHVGIARPTIRFHGTVKLHGTNAAVVINLADSDEGIHFQSRNRILTPEDDNAGFAFAMGQPDVLADLVELFKHIHETDEIARIADGIAIFGEWCGGNVQPGVALAQLPRMFVIFGVCLLFPAGGTWWTSEQLATLAPSLDSIKVIEHFPTFDLVIDFASPEPAQNALIEITNGVEQRCPVGWALGIDGIGEGVVWSAVESYQRIKVGDLRFKTKGPKHSESKVKVLVPVDAERAASIVEFVDNVVTIHRLEKKAGDVRELTGGLVREHTGQFLKLVCSDIVKEESDTMSASGFNPKDVMPAVSYRARQWYLAECEKVAA